MKITVFGDVLNPVLLETTKATALVVSSDDGTPNTVYTMNEDGKGWVRYTKGEDANFSEVARHLGII